jgi:acetyltransferase-like isoleucine patch superfamily enzyme
MWVFLKVKKFKLNDRLVEMKILKKILYKNIKYKNWYLKLYKPSPTQYAEYLKHHNILYSMGSDCYILPSANITDPSYVRMGNNVMLSECTLLGHDGSIRMLNIAYNKRLDRVGKTDIKDNVFIGHGAIVMPNVSIGPNVIIGAGSIVTKDVAEGVVVVGNPAKEVCKVVDLVTKLQNYTDTVPWSELIKNRQGAFDKEIETELKKQRTQYFYNS